MPLCQRRVTRGKARLAAPHRLEPSLALAAGEFEDSALLKTFGQAGVGIFAAPTVTGKDVQRQYRVSLLGRTESVTEHFYAISIERKIKHPAVAAIAAAARDKLFAPAH